MSKKFDIISLNGFMYAVDRDIKMGDICRFKHPMQPDDMADFSEKHIIQDLHHSDYKPYEVRTNNGFGPKEAYFKIVATSDPSLGLPLLPDVEENWFILAKEEWEESKKVMEKMHQPTSQEQQAFFFSGFSFGYKAAKAKQFTEDDMRNAHMTGSISSLNWIKNGIEEEYNHVVKAENYIQSLKPKPKFIWLVLENNVPLVENGYVRVEKWEF